MSFHDRMRNSENSHQGKVLKVLCLCSAGLLRSPTAAHILSAAPFNFNTRAAGIELAYALIPMDKVLLHWADVIICMDQDQVDAVEYTGNELCEKVTDRVYNINCPDNFGYRNPQLVAFMTNKFTEIFAKELNVQS